MKIEPERLVFCFAALILLAGYLAVYRPLEARIAEHYAQIDDGRHLLENELALSRREGTLRDERRTLERWLERVGTRDDRSQLVDRLLQNVAIASRSHHVRITNVAIDATPAYATAGASTSLFDELPLTISARGSYSSLLHVVSDLDRTTLPIRITVDTLANPHRAIERDPELQATFHVTLLREPDNTRETTHAPV